MSVIELTTPRRTAKQIVDPAGTPYPSAITSNVWVSSASKFADPTDGNSIKAFTTGKAYFADLIAAMGGARTEICIAGWQVNWDALLAPGVRLFDVLLQAARANRSLVICVMPWDDTEPVQTYDDQTRSVLLLINSLLGTRQVRVALSPSYADIDNGFFSHHQKQVIIDRQIAFVGGIDIAYGRYDDEHFTLVADADGRQALNRYNPCVCQVKRFDVTERDALADPDLLTGVIDRMDAQMMVNAYTGAFGPAYAETRSARDAEIEKILSGAHQMKYEEATVNAVGNSAHLAANAHDPTTLDAATQPRMPWQDIHCRIEGPAVSDLLRNFVCRWNALPDNRRSKLAMPPPPEAYPRPGNTSIQVLRSASNGHCAQEFAGAVDKKQVPRPAGIQSDIYEAMVSLIEKSRRFIYIENQFFVGALGAEDRGPGQGLAPAAQYINLCKGTKVTQNDKAWLARAKSSRPRLEEDGPPTNRVCQALVKRITEAVMDKARPPFHVYITLPLHPEGTLDTASVAVQVYWTMQTLVRGSHSLLNGIRRALKARELFDAGDEGYLRVHQEGNTEYKSIGLERCFEYVTLLNLRNWARQGRRVLTEQIYVHSKLMIVDDLYALLGSANVNDRSLLGGRDSELAVLVMDNDTLRADVNGKGSRRVVRRFAHDLRKSVWRKLFGLESGVRPASELAQAIDEPGAPHSWRAIQKRAAQNAVLYEAAFPWVPKWSDVSSILPTWDPSLPAPPEVDDKLPRGNLGSPMPFQPEFWQAARHTAAVDALAQVRGFVTALPYLWTEGEHIHFDFPRSLVADNDTAPAPAPDDTIRTADRDHRDTLPTSG